MGIITMEDQLEPNEYGRRYYDIVCKDKFIAIEKKQDKAENLLLEINQTVHNGLSEKTAENNERIKKIDRRLWVLTCGVGGTVITLLINIIIKLV